MDADQGDVVKFLAQEHWEVEITANWTSGWGARRMRTLRVAAASEPPKTVFYTDNGQTQLVVEALGSKGKGKGKSKSKETKPEAPVIVSGSTAPSGGEAYDAINNKWKTLRDSMLQSNLTNERGLEERLNHVTTKMEQQITAAASAITQKYDGIAQSFEARLTDVNTKVQAVTTMVGQMNASIGTLSTQQQNVTDSVAATTSQIAAELEKLQTRISDCESEKQARRA